MYDKNICLEKEKWFDNTVSEKEFNIALPV